MPGLLLHSPIFFAKTVLPLPSKKLIRFQSIFSASCLSAFREFLLLLPALNVRFPFLAGNLSFRENEHSPFLYHLGRNREIDLIRDFSIQPPLQLTVHFSKPEIRTVIQSCWPNKNCFSIRFLYFPHLLSAKIKIHCFLCHSMLLYNKELHFTFCKKSVNSLFTGCK